MAPLVCKAQGDVFHSEEHHKGLAECKTPKIFDHPLSSPPSTKRGDPTASLPEQAPYCWPLRCSCVALSV